MSCNYTETFLPFFFYSIWVNPDTKIFKIVKHLLEFSQPNSRTWSANLRYLAEKYDLPNPLEMLKSSPQNKSSFKELVHTKICSYYERELREMATRKSRMEFFNVSLTSLRGSCHQAIRNIFTTYDVKKCRFHLKMLSGDYLTYSVKAKHSGGSPDCKLCVSSVSENIMHMLVFCTAYSDIRERTLAKYIELCHEIKFPFTEISDSNENLCQFILDPSSVNLKSRIPENHSKITEFMKISRYYCFAIHNKRISMLEDMSLKSSWYIHSITLIFTYITCIVMI